MSQKIYTAIAGAGHYVPEKVLTNVDLETMVETSDEWIRSRTGIRERRIAAEGEYTSHMSIAAARQALEHAGLLPEDVEAIFVATCTPDMIFPSTACLVQAALGARRAYGYDLSSACSGFLMALDAGAAAIESGRVQNALVIGAEKLSAVTDWTNRDTCVLFGDGAGAVVLKPSDRPGLRSSYLGVDGHQADILFIPAGGCKRPASVETVGERQHFIQMAGRETFKIAVNTMLDAAQQAIARANLTAADMDWMVFHQANRRIIDAVAHRLGDGTTDRAIVNLDRYGNTSAASIPIALSEAVADGRVQSGDKILMVAFGGGLSWGGAVVEWL
ncbi:MAG: beta-ketoacyl-ACP synthase III [Kiritimatiellia bacterium]|jgi:3-oxoacyl-[acyl-carrier-protein] synthase-3|nr:beta-ketoacyl-ACP synthase III [Kiritimatiellia bacterium]